MTSLYGELVELQAFLSHIEHQQVEEMKEGVGPTRSRQLASQSFRDALLPSQETLRRLVQNLNKRGSTNRDLGKFI